MLLSEHHSYITVVTYLADHLLYSRRVCAEAVRQALQGQLSSYVEVEVLIEPRSEEIDCDPHVVLQRHVWIYKYRLIDQKRLVEPRHPT